MRIGFTGSRDGMTEQQKQTLSQVLQEYWPVEFPTAIPSGLMPRHIASV